MKVCLLMELSNATSRRDVSNFKSRDYVVAIPPLSLAFLFCVVLLIVAAWLYRAKRLAEQRRLAAIALKDGDWLYSSSEADHLPDLTPEQLGSILGTTTRGSRVPQAKPTNPASGNSGTDVKLRLRIDAHVFALEQWTISRDRLNVYDPLAYGQLEAVYRADLLNARNELEKSVLVKTLIQKGNLAKRERLLCDARKLGSFDHPNVLGLEAVCTDILSDPLIILACPAFGDLKALLRHALKSVVRKEIEIPQGHPQKMKLLQQLSLTDAAVQISRGMKYLSERNIVSADLAARNCLVMDNCPLIKIGDLGVGRTMYPGDYYRHTAHALQPVKWMAPESLKDSQLFTLKSDVWSFGVTVWEIFSLGCMPYAGIPNAQVINVVVNSNGRLPPPFVSQSALPNLLQDCWEEEPEERPDFKQINCRLEAMLSKVKDDLGEDFNQLMQLPLSTRIMAGLSKTDNFPTTEDAGFMSETSAAESSMLS